MDVFDSFTNENVYCDSSNASDACDTNDFEFRYLCDRSSVKMMFQHHMHNNSRLVYKHLMDESEGINEIMVEDNDLQPIAKCLPLYTNEDGERYEIDVVYPNDDWALFNCRIDTNSVGHYLFSLFTTFMGRSRSPTRGTVHN